MSMHLKHPKKRGFLSWEELGSLARALGFQSDIFYNHLPEELTKKENGISIKKLYHLIDFFKYFNAALDRTSNIHTDEWNLHVLKKTVSMLDQRIFSFSELQSIRMAYQIYESPDTKGLVIDEWVLLRALKMCGRTISPLKMMHRIKHMRNNFEEPDRIQLHEFLDLLLWCEMYEGIELRPKEMNTTKDERNMFHLEDFEEVLSHHDERLAARLNALYHKEEWRFTKEKHSNKAMPKDIPPVDAEVRRKQVRHHQERYAHLSTEVGKSQRRVFAARAGYVRPRPVSAPDLHTYEPAVDWSDTSWTSGQERPHTVYEITRHLYNPSPPKAETPDIREEVPRPKVTEYVRPRTPCAVTADDVTSMVHVKEALEFEKETLDQKYERIIEEDQDYLLPGYRNRLANMPPKAPVAEPNPPPTPHVARPSKETLRRLSANKRPGPSASHGKSCDARFRGWYVTKARRGPHVIHTGPTFDLSPTGRLLTKLHHTTRIQGGGTDHAFRYTRRSDVDPAAALAYSTSVLCAGDPSTSGITESTSGAMTTMMSGMAGSEVVPSDENAGDGSTRADMHDGMLNTTADSSDSSKGLNTTRESVDSSRPPSSSDFSDVTIELPAKGDDTTEAAGGDWKRKGRVNEKRRKLGMAMESESLFSVTPVASTKEKVEDRSKDKVIEFRKVGRIEVLEEISEKAEDEEDSKQDSVSTKDKPTSADSTTKHKSKPSRSGSSSSSKAARKTEHLHVEHLELSRATGPTTDASIPSLSSRSESVSSVPYSREVSRLAKSGPSWLTELIVSKDEPKSSVVNSKKACQRLAQRLGGDMSSELRYRLLCSTA